MPDNNGRTNLNGGNGNNMSFSSSLSTNNGIGGYMERGLAQKELSTKFWDENSGYLKQASRELDDMIKSYERLLSYSNDMTKANKRTADERKAQLEKELQYVKLIQEQKDVSAEAAQELLKSTATILLDSQKKLANTYAKLKAENKDLMVDIKGINDNYIRLKTDFSGINKRYQIY